MRIMTVTGPVSAAILGPTDMHEHMAIRLRTPPDIGPASDAEVEDAVRAAKEFVGSGGSCIVDLTNRGMGQDAQALRRISEDSRAYIVCGTGFYREPFLPDWVRERPVEALAEVLIRDLTEGVDGTGVCAGIIGEIGSSFGVITPLEEKVFHAAARAHLATGAAISTHTTYGTMLLEQVEMLDSARVSLNRVIIGHCELCTDLNVLLEVLRRGATLAFDTVGKERWAASIGGSYEVSDRTRIALILNVLEAGYENQVVLGSDVMGYARRQEAELNPATFGAHGLAYLIRRFVPQLLEAGVSERTIGVILVETPRRLLAFQL